MTKPKQSDRKPTASEAIDPTPTEPVEAPSGGDAEVPESETQSEVAELKEQIAAMAAKNASLEAEIKAKAAGFSVPPPSSEPRPRKAAPIRRPASSKRTAAQDADPNLRWRQDGQSFGHYQRVK